MHKITMCHSSEPFPSYALFMCFGLQRLCSLSRRLVGFHHTTIHCFELLLMAIFLRYIRFHDARILFVSLAGHGWSHRSFQFSPRGFENVFVLFVIRIDKVNPSQCSKTVELWSFFCPFLFFSFLSGFDNFRPNFWPDMIWSGSRLNLCQSLPG